MYNRRHGWISFNKITDSGMQNMNGAVIYDGIRSPFGRYGGGLSAKRPDDLAAAVIRSLLDRSGIDSSLVEDVILGNTNQAGEDCRNVARISFEPGLTP